MSGASLPRRTLAIVGGTYLEGCQWPNWSEFFGSGLRASAALSGRDASITLHTFVSAARRKNLESLATIHGFFCPGLNATGTYEFRYRHSLSEPEIIRPSKQPDEPLVVEGGNILTYGMMEGNAIVRADCAVYDPQSSRLPKGFRENGSDANRLAIVANEAEVCSLSGSNNVEAAAAKLRERERAETIVVKRGLNGVLVLTDSGLCTISAYRTRRSFLIGSGDIFSAEFAYRWLCENRCAEEAAHFASLAVAYYSQNPSVPVPSTLPLDFAPVPIVRPQKRQTQTYLAGPFFNVQQLWMVEETLGQLSSHGVNVFSPFHEIGLGEPTVVVEKDLSAIVKSDSVFALLDDFDPGTLFEIGFARALKKPVTIFANSGASQKLTMLIGSGCDIFEDFVSAICWEASR